MSKKTKIWGLSAIIVLLLVLLYFFGINRNKKFVTEQWRETYEPADKGPYGTNILKQLLDTNGIFGEFLEIDKTLSEALKDNPDSNDIYFYVGKENYMDEEEVESILDFTYAGNTAFIATEQLPQALMDEFFYDSDDIYEYIRDTTQYFGFTHPDLKQKQYRFDYIYRNKAKEKKWSTFIKNNYDLYESSDIFVLGTNQIGEANFIKITYGDGAIYFHTEPYTFTNICMIKPEGFEYIDYVFKHIPPGRVQWDRYNLQSHFKYNNSDSNGGDEDRRSMLEFIFQHLSLTWAFIIFLITALLFVIFKGRRMQDIVPPAEEKSNTSMTYIDTISSLYLENQQHGKLVRLKEKTFLNYISEKYYLNTSKINEKFITHLVEKSGVEEPIIKEIFNLFDNYRGFAVLSDSQLINLHQKIEYFYKKCK